MPTENENRSESVGKPTAAESSGASDKPQSKDAENGDSAKGKSPETSSTLKNEPGPSSDSDKAVEAMQRMNIADLLTELSSGEKNRKDAASYKFWRTQPVTQFSEQSKLKEDGPIKEIDPDKVPKQPDPLLVGFEWTTLDLTDEKELKELWDLLTYHYVEDDDAMFRFRYSQSFLYWYVLSSHPHITHGACCLRADLTLLLLPGH